MMTRLAFLFSAFAVAAPAAASTYVAQTAAPAVTQKFVTRDVVWTPTAGGFRARTDESRPLVLCQGLAKRAGVLASFTVDGQPIADAELAKCNAAAPAASNAGAASAR